MSGTFTSDPPFDSSTPIPEQVTPIIPVVGAFISDDFESEDTPPKGDSFNYATLFSDDFGYTHYDIDSRYDTDNGLLVIPIAGPPGTAAEVIRVHAPLTKKVVQWTAERAGDVPTLPSANTGVANEILAHKTIFGAAPPVEPFGVNHVYRFSGTYFYVMPVPKSDSDPLCFGKLPYDITASVENSVDVSDFDITILQSM